MKQAKKIIWIPLFFFLVYYSCTDQIVEPIISKSNYGITGKIVDTTGKPINDVNIYCLFFYNNIPDNQYLLEKISNVLVDSFGYSFDQNFPNPVYNSTFIRFSIPTDMEIEFLLKEKLSGEIRYSFSDSYNYGLYQYYFDEIVSNQQLENGCYLIMLRGLKHGELHYETDKKMFIVSDIGNPNAISNKDGIYFFDYRKAFIGDTLFKTSDDYVTDTLIVPNQVNLLFKKEGYSSEKINVSLYPELLFNQDVILRRED